MKKQITFIACCLFSCIGFAQVQMPAPSPTQTVSQDFGLGKIKIVYSRPSAKGRTMFKENSDLAPLGKLWRTGANSATVISFTDFVNFDNKKIDSGSYALYTIPGKNEWEIILNKGVNNGGTNGYKESDDVLRFKAKAYNTSKALSVENFTIQFENIKPESCDMLLLWGNTAVVIPVTTNIKDRIKVQIDEALQSNNKPYFQAANFYNEWEKDYPKALEYTNKALEQNKEAFWIYMLKARLEKQLGDKVAAKESALKCINLAQKASNDDYVQQGNRLINSL